MGAVGEAGGIKNFKFEVGTSQRERGPFFASLRRGKATKEDEGRRRGEAEEDNGLTVTMQL
jgi:hypothetical protein